MEDKTAYILDFSGVWRDDGVPGLAGVPGDPMLPAVADGPSVRVDLSDLTGTSCYLDPTVAPVLRERLAPVPLHALRWIDSGDYHYLSKFFSDRIGEPFSLLLLDNHPDMQPPAFGPLLSCGGWVRDLLLEQPFLHRVYLVGSDPSLAEETAPFGDRVVRSDDTLPPTEGEPLYISLDKDVLSPRYARTDWSQGNMEVAELEGILRQAFTGHRILGVDVCGALPRSKGGREADFAVNRATNIALYQLLLSIL